MGTIVKYLNGESIEMPHPFVDECDRLDQNGYSIVNVRFYRERKGLSFLPAMLYVEFKKDTEGKTIHHDWHIDIEKWLLNKNVKAVSNENEAERMGYYLIQLFNDAPFELGEGYMNAVLMENLRDDFGDVPALIQTLKEIPFYRANKSSKFYSSAVEYIEKCYKTIIKPLIHMGYTKETTESIFYSSLIYFLDERFSLTNSRLLGLSSK